MSTEGLTAEELAELCKGIADLAVCDGKQEKDQMMNNMEELTADELAELRKIFVPNLGTIANASITAKLIIPDQHLLLQLDEMVRTMYLQYRLSPSYMFVSDELRQRIAQALEEQYKNWHRMPKVMQPLEENPPVVLVHAVTGRLIYVIALPYMTSLVDVTFGFLK